MKYIYLIPLLFLLACQKNVNTTPLTPVQKIAVYNGILAESNKALVTGVIQLNTSKVLTVSQTSLVLDYSLRVANASKAVAILQQNQGNWNVIAGQIKIVLDQVVPSGDILKTLGATGEQGKVVLSTITSIQSAISSILVEAAK
jgi:thiamine transporter ThiT